MRTLRHGVDRPFRFTETFLRQFSILADRSIGIYALLRNVVHARRQNISALPGYIGSAEDTLGKGITMKRPYWIFIIFGLFGYAKILAAREIPQIIVGEPSFFRTTRSKW